MKIKHNSLYECLHLDTNYFALTVQNLMTLRESFNLLDVHGDDLLNDLQTKIWMKHNTSLKFPQVVAIFELLDIHATGFCDFDMFYFFNAIMLAVKDKLEKEFVNRHARSLYSLFEVRMKGKMTHEQFEMVGWLFGFNKKMIKLFHKEFDISVYKRTIFEEFKLFVLICLELQSIQDKKERIRANDDYRERLIRNLKPKLVSYLKFNQDPNPRAICRDIRWTQRPYMKKGRDIRRLNLYWRVRKYTTRKFRIFAENHPILCLKFHLCLKKVCKRRKKVMEDAQHHYLHHHSGLTGMFLQWITLLRRKHRRTGANWGEDMQLLVDETKHEEVAEASRMPSWIGRLDKLKAMKHALPINLEPKPAVKKKRGAKKEESPSMEARVQIGNEAEEDPQTQGAPDAPHPDEDGGGGLFHKHSQHHHRHHRHRKHHRHHEPQDGEKKVDVKGAKKTEIKEEVTEATKEKDGEGQAGEKGG